MARKLATRCIGIFSWLCGHDFFPAYCGNKTKIAGARMVIYFNKFQGVSSDGAVALKWLNDIEVYLESDLDSILKTVIKMQTLHFLIHIPI